MSLSFDFTTLRRAYREQTTNPVSVAEDVLARIAAAGDDGVWITRVPENALLAEANKKGWIVISMKDDWKRIFAFDK